MQDAVLEREALRKFSSISAVPYQTPLDAAKGLFPSTEGATLASKTRVNIRESDSPVREKKAITIVYRDEGIGLSPKSIPNTILALASSKKSVPWQQGAFGIGGKTTFRNAKRIIVISRKAPETLDGAEDRISIAVLQWDPSGKTQTATYLVTAPWNSRGDDPPVFSIPAASYPDFEPGTQLSLISYGVEYIWVGTRLGDERSFDTLLNTRLFEPVLPVRFNHFQQRDSPANLRGLSKRLHDSPGNPPRPHATETLPFSASGITYHLPISFWAFAGPTDDTDQRRRFVAKEHVVCFTSNGQVHHHLNQADFSHSIPTLKKLADRIFIVIKTDELPIELRSTLFSADRSSFMRTVDALRLEEQVNAFIREWQILRDLNGELIRESLTKAQTGRSTISLAKELGRAFKGIGFGNTTLPPKPKNGNHPVERRGIELMNDPSYIDGPTTIRAFAGKIKFIQYTIDAKDGFIPERASIEVEITNECGLSTNEITIGQLANGRLRVSLAVPEFVAEGECKLTLSLTNWLLSTGGIGPTLQFQTSIETYAVEQEHSQPPASKANKSKTTNEEASSGDLIPIIWTNCAGQETWTTSTIGSVELMSGEAIASAVAEYAELKTLGSQEIYTLLLNEDFGQFTKYVRATARDSTVKTLEKKKDRYAIGVGTGLINLKVEHDKIAKDGQRVSEEIIEVCHHSIAAAVLADMRAYDKLAEESGTLD